MEYKEIKKLMDDMGDSKLTELEIEFPDGIRISMKKEDGKVKQAQLPINMIQAQAPIEVKNNNKVNGNIVKSPMVGTFYSKLSSKVEPFVKIGSKVKKGDTLCIIEAMKLMNEIKSEEAGKIIKICVKNGDPVEFGQVLMYVE